MLQYCFVTLYHYFLHYNAFYYCNDATLFYRLKYYVVSYCIVLKRDNVILCLIILFCIISILFWCLLILECNDITLFCRQNNKNEKNTKQHTIQKKKILNNTIKRQHTTTRHDTTQHNITQYNTAQHNITQN